MLIEKFDAPHRSINAQNAHDFGQVVAREVTVYQFLRSVSGPMFNGPPDSWPLVCWAQLCGLSLRFLILGVFVWKMLTRPKTWSVVLGLLFAVGSMVTPVRLSAGSCPFDSADIFRRHRRYSYHAHVALLRRPNYLCDLLLYPLERPHPKRVEPGGSCSALTGTPPCVEQARAQTTETVWSLHPTQFGISPNHCRFHHPLIG